MYGGFAALEIRSSEIRGDNVFRKLSSGASSWVKLPGRKLEPTNVILVSTEGGCQVQHLQEMPDRSACPESDGLQRGRPLAGGQLLERTEESSAGRRREFVVSSLRFSFISGSTWTSTEAAAAVAEANSLEWWWRRPVPWCDSCGIWLHASDRSLLSRESS